MADNLLYNSSGGSTVATMEGTGSVHFPKVLPCVDDGSGDPPPVPGDATNGMMVDVTRLPTGTTAAATTVAHDAADSGHPIKIGGVARDGNPTAVADGDRVDSFFDLVGRLMVGKSPREAVVKDQTTITNDTTETEILAAGAAGIRRDLTKLRISNRSTTTPVQVTLRDILAGTAIDIITVGPMANVDINYDPPLPQGSDADQWTAELSVNTVTVDIFAQAIES